MLFNDKLNIPYTGYADEFYNDNVIIVKTTLEYIQWLQFCFYCKKKLSSFISSTQSYSISKATFRANSIP